jgi:hypothetical protein
VVNSAQVQFPYIETFALCKLWKTRENGCAVYEG